MSLTHVYHSPAILGVHYFPKARSHFTAVFLTPAIPGIPVYRAYIEFNPDPSQRVSGGVLPAVYVAVKMRQLRIPLTVKLLDTGVISEKMRALTDMQSTRCQQLSKLRTNR